jgi:hypothetical protein
LSRFSQFGLFSPWAISTQKNSTFHVPRFHFRV